jgi:hypothetical protein
MEDRGLASQDSHDGSLGREGADLQFGKAAHHVLVTVAVQHGHLHRPAGLVREVDDQPVGEAGHREAGEALQRPGHVQAHGKVAGRLGQQDRPGLGRHGGGEGGPRLGEQLVPHVGGRPLDEPGGKPDGRPLTVAERAERAERDRALQRRAVAAANGSLDLGGAPGQQCLSQQVRRGRIGQPAEGGSLNFRGAVAG